MGSCRAGREQLALQLLRRILVHFPTGTSESLPNTKAYFKISSISWHVLEVCDRHSKCCMGSVASLQPHGGSMPHLCYEGWQVPGKPDQTFFTSCWKKRTALQVKRESGWDADSNLLVQTNPPEGPAVLHVTSELGEHISGKYWLVEGGRLWQQACIMRICSHAPTLLCLLLQGEFRNHRHVWKRASSAGGPWISSGSDGSWFLHCSPSSLSPAHVGPLEVTSLRGDSYVTGEYFPVEGVGRFFF